MRHRFGFTAPGMVSPPSTWGSGKRTALFKILLQPFFLWLKLTKSEIPGLSSSGTKTMLRHQCTIPSSFLPFCQPKGFGTSS